MKHESWIAAAGVSGFIIDRILKYYVLSFPAGKVFSFAPGIEFGHFLNPSLFFFTAWSWIPWLALTVLLVLTTYYILHTTFLVYFPLIILGGASNVFDRFVYGGVVDYVNILGVATLNLADILIVLGLLILLAHQKRPPHAGAADEA